MIFDDVFAISYRLFLLGDELISLLQRMIFLLKEFEQIRHLKRIGL